MSRLHEMGNQSLTQKETMWLEQRGLVDVVERLEMVMSEHEQGTTVHTKIY